MAHLQLPDPLGGIFFEHVWDTQRIWQLPTPVSVLPLSELWWHVELPIWSTIPGEARFDLAPITVMRFPSFYRRHWERIRGLNPSYALELFENCGRWVIVDGYHRIVRHHIEGKNVVLVRKHPPEFWEHVVLE